MNAWTEDKRREEMLRELELLPVWRQRAASPVVPTLGQAAAVEQSAVVEQTAVVAPVTAEASAPDIATAVPAHEATLQAVPESELHSAPDILAPEMTDYAAELAPAALDSSAQVLQVAEPAVIVPVTHEETPAVAEIAAPADAVRPHEASLAANMPDGSDDHAAEREYYAASPTAWMEYAESVEPDWYSQEELAAATPDRRAQIMGMAWQALQESVPGCQACQLHSTRTQTVFGVGDPQAEWLFVGEAPGAEEDKRGEPFVGQAGKLLDNMLAAIQLKRGENVYIANVLKCRPPANRDPQGEEVQQCEPYLKRQVELIQPKLIVALGKFAAQSLLQNQHSIASLRGGLHDFHGVPVIVTYHPAYLLRNLPDKARAWEDLCLARETMRGLQSQQATPSSR